MKTKYIRRSWKVCLMACLLLLVVVSFLGCHSGDKKQIVVMWNTDETDPVYQQWTEKLERELSRQGIDAELHMYYAQEGKLWEAAEKKNLDSLVWQLDSLGKHPDMIFAHGDLLHWLLDINPDSAVCSIPVVCYGLNTLQYRPRQYALLEKDQLKGRTDAVCIYDTLCLKQNLDFANYIANLRCPDSIQGQCPDSVFTWNGKYHRHRFVSLLDPFTLWCDSNVLDRLHLQMLALDTARYYDNLENQADEGTLQGNNAKCKVEFSFRSFLDPTKTQRADVFQMNPTWIFYMQKSPYMTIQTKHDYQTRSCTEGPNFPPYFTMIGEDFLTNDSCIGGYFATTDQQISDAVTAAKRLMAGETAAQIGKLFHEKTLNVNWDALRNKGLRVSQMPSDAVLYNDTLRDHHPLRWSVLVLLGSFLLTLFIICLIEYGIRSIKRIRLNRRQIHDQSEQIIENRRILENTLTANDITLCSDADLQQLVSQMKLSDYYREKVNEFLGETKDGSYQMELQGSRDGGDLHWYSLRVQISTEEGMTHRKGMLINIDRIKEQEAKEQEYHRIRLNARTRQGFIASMRHEIRTPLNAIVGFAQVFSAPDTHLEKQEMNEMREAMTDNATALRKMIDDLLLVTLMNNSNIAPQMQPCALANILCLDAMGDAKRLTVRRKNKVIFQPFDKDLSVQADPQMLTAVMQNLLLNASKFSAEGSTIEVRLTQQDSTVSLHVQDHGVGIDEDKQELIFERFFKVNSFEPGCGLGLYISKVYTELMGGTITVESRRGEGSTFTVTLPSNKQSK